ncbi:phytanoyl-CoA dioxygenase family protein [Undibacterium sp. RTI2.1]|uniref:phytanoyl-CoA dioxygenase family protein n=1 Tax=unclassified Undibacterium TaxID=2630295 RepID=UPI002B2257EC|nr:MULTISPECIES: phytanoyl-CoA dioxygenase family protein [unclassified Undibacterium]MEB0031008.1 phytanoyl-CoA dioxygenase family protein [Undibacterium sp. RTI2.1]MEB0115855.1 phytanoyl-CoA dioxygenase family protein [Undibacterium sp. RTI2.2]
MPTDTATFEQNINTNEQGKHLATKGQTTQLKDIQKTKPLRVLSEADWQHWVTKGYVIIRKAVPPEKTAAVVNMLWQFREMNPVDDTTWYPPHLSEQQARELSNSGMVEVYNHQSMWDTRQHPRVYDAFVDIWDREDLWVTIDRANVNLPDRDTKISGQVDGFIHFDVDVSKRPLPISVQGVLSLLKQDLEVGGFQCVPGIFAQIDTWWNFQPKDSNPFQPDTTNYEIITPELDAGDLVIFNSLLAHGVRQNRSENRVRMAQYIAMSSADVEDAPLRQARIHTWSEQTHPTEDPFPGDPRGFEKKHFARAQLNPLGRKLLGLDAW